MVERREIANAVARPRGDREVASPATMRQLFPPFPTFRLLQVIDADVGVPSLTVEDACIPCLEAGYKL